MLGEAYTPEELKEHIANPSHAFAKEWASESGAMSRMPDYDAMLTDQKMVDLITYLRKSE